MYLFQRKIISFLKDYYEETFALFLFLFFIFKTLKKILVFKIIITLILFIACVSINICIWNSSCQVIYLIIFHISYFIFYISYFYYFCSLNIHFSDSNRFSAGLKYLISKNSEYVLFNKKIIRFSNTTLLHFNV